MRLKYDPSTKTIKTIFEQLLKLCAIVVIVLTGFFSLSAAQTIAINDLQRSFAHPPDRSGMQAMLEGPIRDAAVIYVNEQRAGSVWCPPYSIDITSLLRRGANKIRVEVSNTAINYMAGHSLPDYRLLNLRYGERFQPQEMEKVQPVASDLFEPIRLVSTR